MDRRTFLGVSAAAAGAGALVARAAPAAPAPGTTRAAFRHSVTRWPFPKLSVDELARAAKRLELQSVELLDPAEWAVAKAHGLTCAMGYAPAGDPKTRLTKGWNRTE